MKELLPSSHVEPYLLGWRKNEKPIISIRGGCDKYIYCRFADDLVKQAATSQAVDQDPDQPKEISIITPLKDECYRRMRNHAVTMIGENNHAIAINDIHGWIIEGNFVNR